jgi:hypothetical protein
MVMGEQLPKTRKLARELGKTSYFTGAPCKRGHVSPRYTLTCNCIQCMSERIASDRQAFRDAKASIQK